MLFLKITLVIQLNANTIHTVFDTYFWGCQSTGPTAPIFMFISQILSATRADFYVIFSKFVSPDEEHWLTDRRYF